MRKMLFLLSSARRNGNTERLAVRAVPPNAEARWLDLAAMNLPRFRDLRPHFLKEQDQTLMSVLADMQWADDIVFVAPIYWYSLPAPAKLFLDHWSGFLDAPDLDFPSSLTGKRLWLITCRADPDPDVARPVEDMMRRTAQWLGLTWGGALHGIGTDPGDVEKDQAWDRAASFFAGVI